MEGKTKIYVFGAILIALIFLAYFLYQSNSKPTTTTTGGQSQATVGAGGLFGAFQQLIGNINFSPNLNASGITHGTNPATQNSATDCYNGCSSSNPGYDCLGNPSSYCQK